MELIDHFRRELHRLLEQTRPHSLWVSLSGGLDSVVLLHLLAGARDQLDGSLPLHAVHVHHGLSRHADSWLAHCQAECQNVQVPLSVCHVHPRQGARLSLEAEARRARYQAIREALPQGALLLTGHHLTDQTETFLIRLQRGSGPAGLSAMATVTEVLPGLTVARPLLDVERSVLAHYAGQHQLCWVEDESNQDQGFDRNFIRHQVLPLLRQRWPSIDFTIARSARLCREQEQLLQEYCGDELATAVEGEEMRRISVSYLQRLSQTRQAYLLRYWLQLCGVPMPSAAQLHNIQVTMLGEREDTNPEVSWSGWVLRRYRQQLYLEQDLPQSALAQHCLHWTLAADLDLPAGLGSLIASRQTASPAQPLLALPEGSVVTVRFRQPNLICQPYRRAGRRCLKKLLHEYRVPPWQRSAVPLIFYGDELVAAVGLWICEGYAVTHGDGLHIAQSK